MGSVPCGPRVPCGPLYGQRAQVETDFSMFERLLDSAVRSRRRYAIDRVIILRVITINLMILLCLWWRHLLSTGQGTVQIGSELRHATGPILAKGTCLALSF